MLRGRVVVILVRTRRIGWMGRGSGRREVLSELILSRALGLSACLRAAERKWERHASSLFRDGEKGVE